LARARLSFLFMVLGLSSSSMAQVNFPASWSFDQYFNNYYLLNPANTDTSYKVKIRATDKSLTGLFQGVSRIYFDGDAKIKAGKQAFHFLGVQAVNSREGDFINLSKLFVRYSWRQRISEGSSLSAGISLGFVNYAFKTTQAGPGGSDATPDGSAGIWYLRERFAVGFSVQQMFKGKLQPVNQVFELNRYYNFNAYKIFRLSPYVNLNTHFYSGFQKNQTSNINLTALLEVQDKLEAGVSYRYKKAIGFIAGLKKINIASVDCSLFFSYLIRTGPLSVNDNAIEVYLSFQK
jgi:type IX secretion system PorP/SprF family membrane protein